VTHRPGTWPDWAFTGALPPGWPASLTVLAAARELDPEHGFAGPRLDGDLAVVAFDDDAA
jgi:hypothetical protein